MEYDRDQLHEIARKDKATIHEQNVRLRELVLQERNLRTQVTSLEDSERSLYNRCSELEDTVTRLEDRVHELEVSGFRMCVCVHAHVLFAHNLCCIKIIFLLFITII